MIPGYDGLRKSGRAKMDVRPRIVRETPVSAVVDGGGGLGHVPAHFAMSTAIAKARKTGMAAAVVQWTRESGVAAEAEPGFGARFTQITPEGRQLVYRYTRNREPMFYDDL